VNLRAQFEVDDFVCKRREQIAEKKKQYLKQSTFASASTRGLATQQSTTDVQ